MAVVGDPPPVAFQILANLPFVGLIPIKLVEHAIDIDPLDVDRRRWILGTLIDGVGNCAELWAHGTREATAARAARDLAAPNRKVGNCGLPGRSNDGPPGILNSSPCGLPSTAKPRNVKTRNEMNGIRPHIHDLNG